MRIKTLFAGAAFGLAMTLSSVVQAQCLLCGVIGYALGAAGSSEQATGASPNVVYVLPNIAGRLPAERRLEVMFAASETYRFAYTEQDRLAHAKKHSHWAQYNAGKNVRIREIFKATVPEADRYEVLEVMRLIKPDDLDRAIFWFAYIEKDKLERSSVN